MCGLTIPAKLTGAARPNQPPFSWERVGPGLEQAPLITLPSSGKLASGRSATGKTMSDYFVPSNIFQGRGSAESPGTGRAVGDTAITSSVGAAGVDYMPNGIEPGPATAGGINHKSIGVLASDSTGDSDKEQPAAFLEAFQRMGANASQFRLGVQGGAPVVVPQCAFAGPSASGNFYVAPADIGGGPGQIPGDSAGWTLPVLRPHVSVFVRDASHCRGVVSQLGGSTDAGATNSASPSVQVFVVDGAPKWSSWALVVDGHAQTVIFPHVTAAGTIDVRRPRDIWAKLIVPELQRRIAQAEPLPLYRDAGFGTLVTRGYISRLNYVSYARFGAFDSQTPTVPVFVPPPPPP